MRTGVSILEVVLGAIILGLSGVVVLELVRSNTVSLEITEVEAVARGLGGDAMERFSRRSSFDTPTMTKLLKQMQGQPVAWKDVFTQDPSLSYKLPADDISKLLDLYDVRLRVEFKAATQSSLGDKPRMRVLSVEVSWNDPRHGTASELKKVEYAALVP